MEILLLDIETRPHVVYTWGLWNQTIPISGIVESGSTLCVAWKWYGKKKVEFASTWEDGMEDMLHRIHSAMDKADAVVHYNGGRFDVPTLNKEFIKHSMVPPSPSIHIDLLKVARKQFKFTSNKLDYVAKYLGLDGKLEHKGFDLWKECMAGVPKSLRQMKAYNKKDVEILERVYDKMKPWIKSHPNHSVFAGAPCCPNCGSSNLNKNGYYYTRAGKYQRYACTQCGAPARGTENLASKQDKLIGV